MPQFSILIPTRNRPDTLKYTIETVLAQTFDDYEVIVANNGSNPEASRLIAEFASPRLKEVRSDVVLPMSENWERGLDACTGEYIIVVGDDDGLMPDALAYANHIFTSTGAKLLSCGWHYYYWPQALTSWLRGRIGMSFPKEGNSIITYSSSQVLRQAASFELHPLFNPNIYSGFVHRSVIEKCKERLGMYFAHQIPDWFSGLVNLYFTDTFIQFSRPLGMRGISHHSNGGGIMAFGDGGKDVVDRFFDETGADNPKNFGAMEKLYHPLSVIADVFTHAKKVLITDRDEAQFNYQVCVFSLVNGVNRSRGGYHALVAEAKRVAERYGVDISKIKFPEEEISDNLPIPPQGPHIGEDGKCIGLFIDGQRCGVTNVAEAVRLAASIMPY